MDEVRAKAFKLRLAGKSYNEIYQELGVSKSTQSGWFKDLVLSDAARRRLADRASLGSEVLIRRNKGQTRTAELRALSMQKTGKEQIKSFDDQNLLITGAILYWAEGYKRLVKRGGRERMSHAISFLNADPDMITVFVKFLTHSLRVVPADIRLTIRLHPHTNEEDAKIFWLRATGLDAANFNMSTRMISRASKGVRPYNRLPYGTLQVAVYSTAKFHHLMGLIEGVKEKAIYGKLQTLPG